MAVCDTCGNDYHLSFTVTLHNGDQHTFDCFECAIHLAAPRCHHCNCRIIGHGHERDGIFYCCEHCLVSTPAENVPFAGVNPPEVDTAGAAD